MRRSGQGVSQRPPIPPRSKFVSVTTPKNIFNFLSGSPLTAALPGAKGRRSNIRQPCDAKEYAQVFQRDMTALEGFDGATVAEMLDLVSAGNGGHNDLGRFYASLYERYFKDREWCWPEYDAWRTYFSARKEWPVGWPEDHKSPRTERLTEIDKRRTYRVLLSTIGQRASALYSERRQRADGITAGSISTAYPENEAIIKDVLAENPGARPPLFPYDVSFWMPVLPKWFDEPPKESDDRQSLRDVPNETEWIYKCPDCMEEIQPRARVCKWCGAKFRSGNNISVWVATCAILSLLVLVSTMRTQTVPAVSNEEWLPKNGGDPRALDDRFGNESESACSRGANDFLKSIAAYDFKWDSEAEGFMGIKFDKFSLRSAGNGLLTSISTRARLSNQYGAFSKFQFYCLYDVRDGKVIRYSQTDPADDVPISDGQSTADDTMEQAGVDPTDNSEPANTN